MRHLATIREITTLRPIAGADRIEVAQVDGKVINPDFLLAEKD